MYMLKKKSCREKKKSVRGGIRTHAHIRGPECYEPGLPGKVLCLESGALDHSATLTAAKAWHKISFST